MFVSSWYVGVGLWLGQVGGPKPMPVFVLDRIPTASEQGRLAKGDMGKLVPLSVGSERFQCFVDPSLTANEDLRLAQQALSTLSARDLSTPFPISALPDEARKKVLARLNSMLPNAGGRPSILSSTQLRIFQRTTVPLEGQGRQLALIREVAPNPSQRSDAVSLANSGAPTGASTRTRTAWLLWSPNGLNERDYWKLLSEVSTTLLRQRSEAEATYQREFDRACRAWFGETVEQARSAAPASVGALKGDWLRRWQELEKGLRPNERSELGDRKFGVAQADVFFFLQIGNMKLNISFRAMFEGSD